MALIEAVHTTLSSGRGTNLFIDSRGLSDATVRAIAYEMLGDKSLYVPDLVVAVMEGGFRFAEAVARYCSRPLFLYYPDPTGGTISPWRASSTYILDKASQMDPEPYWAMIVDDVLTTGGSLRRTKDFLRTINIRTGTCLVLFDRRERGPDGKPKKLGLPVRAFATLNYDFLLPKEEEGKEE